MMGISNTHHELIHIMDVYSFNPVKDKTSCCLEVGKATPCHFYHSSSGYCGCISRSFPNPRFLFGVSDQKRFSQSSIKPPSLASLRIFDAVLLQGHQSVKGLTGINHGEELHIYKETCYILCGFRCECGYIYFVSL